MTVIAAAIERCGGIDVGKKFLAVCIMVGPLEGEPHVEIQRFGTTVLELRRLRDWLNQESITHVAMESTGSYWKPVFNILEDAVRVYLANPQDVKNRKGHKTDNKDGWWLAHLLRHAMIQPSFIPPRAIRELRDLTRRRRRLLGNGSSEKNRVQKILEDANVKLGNVLADVFGVSGQLMLEALLEGKAGPQEIAQLAKRRARQRIPEIAAALEEHPMNAHHRRMIRYSLEHMQFIEQQIIQLDKDIAQKIRESGLERPNGNCCKACLGCKPTVPPPFWRRPEQKCSSLEMRSTSVRGRESVPATIAVRGKTRAITRQEVIRGCGVP